MEQLILESDKGTVTLGPQTLVFALDDTGHENFKDPNHPVFGLGGCGFLVRDYSRLIDEPWNNMCQTVFKEQKRPLHAANIKFTREQMENLSIFFSSYEFFRIAVTTNHNLINKTENGVIELIGNVLLSRITEVGKWAEFDRLFILFESSERIESKVLAGISNKAIIRANIKIPIELAIIPKSACMSGWEIADFIAHTCGAQARTMEQGIKSKRKDFDLIFNSINKNLTSFMHIQKAAYDK